MLGKIVSKMHRHDVRMIPEICDFGGCSKPAQQRFWTSNWPATEETGKFF